MSDWNPSFAQPQWIHAVWLVAALTALLIWLDARSTRSLDRFISPIMQARLVSRRPRKRRLIHIGLIALAGLCIVMALMRPQWGRHFVQTPRIGAQIMICLDVSRSMLAEDTAPNRLERAKADIDDLLTYLGDDHVGLTAFAGRAAVLCPLTPDFGFYRLVLESAGPHSVARGGTNLEAPIREALDGFRGDTDASRAIILITDGEDHDSFPLEAAQVAKERGVRIITIGFGDEAGSNIDVTDPRTGARVQLRDGDGKPVVSRLDGELLRKIALETEGVYVPAGVGALDLKSIYDAHIAPLTRSRLDDRGRLVQHEAFQAPLLAAIVCLFALAVLAGGATRVTAAAMIIGSLLAPPAHAEEVAPIDPRATYNQALAMMADATRFDDAEQNLLDARRHSGADALVRFNATYNLAWVEIHRADELIEEKPAEALEHLERAADWFRDAVRLDPDDRAARENLEIIARRILALRDALADRKEKDLAAKLDELIGQQRQVAGLLQDAVQRVAELQTPDVPEHLRDEFRAFEAEQRRVLSDLDQLMIDSRAELDQLHAIEDDKRTPEQSMQRFQLANVLHYLHEASQRLGQTRSQLRRRQADRAYRRASAGLSSMKQARDVLRDPVELLGALITDATAVTRYTGAMTEEQRPAWLTREYLQDEHESTRSRTDLLATRVEAGAKADDAQLKDDQQRKLVALLREASPHISAARDAFAEALAAIESQRDTDAYEADISAIKALVAARELFLDIRGLIEAMYGDQRRIQAAIEQADNLNEYLSMLTQLQSKNIERGERLDGLIDEALAALEAPAAPEADPAQPNQQTEAQKQQHQMAKALLEQVMTTFNAVQTSLAKSQTDALAEPVDQSVEQLELLRRLFFSIIEHLKDTARRQAQLIDETRDAAATPDAPAGAMHAHQSDLAQMSRQIAASLKSQSQQSGVPSISTQQVQNPQASQDAAAKLGEAAKRVDEGAAAMDDAIEKLAGDPPQYEPAGQPQQTALQKLIEAIALLQPPQQQPQQQQQDQQQQNGENQQQQEGEKQEQAEQQQQQTDMRHVLQQVRDREAQRQRERRRRQAGYQPVEKDW